MNFTKIRNNSIFKHLRFMKIDRLIILTGKKKK
jgi:hypothetical protein